MGRNSEYNNYPKWKPEGTVSIRKLADISNYTPATRGRVDKRESSYRLSMAHEALATRWLVAAQEAGEIPLEGLTEGYHWIGVDENWPIWLSVGAVQALILQHSGEKLPMSSVGKWLMMKEIKKRQVPYQRSVRGGKKQVPSAVRMYRVGSLRLRT